MDKPGKDSTKAFLEKMEQNRRAQPCSRVIDLRKRVPGECNPYVVGGITHFLDDRSYLLLKALIAQYKGVYTVGAYEAVIEQAKWLRDEAQTQSAGPVDPDEQLLLISKDTPQVLEFDRIVFRSEERVQKVSKVQLHWQEITYHGTTWDLCTQAVRIILKRSSSLEVGSIVRLDFSELYETFGLPFLNAVPSTLLRVTQLPQATHVVVQLQGDEGFTQWFRAWLQRERGEQKNLNHNDALYHVVFKYYKRAFCFHLPYPVFFTRGSHIEQAFLTNVAATGFSFADATDKPLYLAPQALQAYLTPGKDSRVPLYLWRDETGLHYFSGVEWPGVTSKQIVAWLKNQPRWRIWLLRYKKLNPLSDMQQRELLQFTPEPEMAKEITALQAKYRQYDGMLSLIDLTPFYRFLPADPTAPAPPLVHTQPLEKQTGLTYTLLSPRLERSESRILLEVTVHVYYDEQTFTAKTLNISAKGLKVALPTEAWAWEKDATVQIDFTDWIARYSGQDWFGKQEAETLRGVNYRIVNIEVTPQGVFVGLMLDHKGKSPLIYKLLKHEMARAEAESGLCLCLANRVEYYRHDFFGTWLTHNLNSLPFFLGRDDEGIRLIQAIVKTQDNQTLRSFLSDDSGQEDWSSLQALSTTFGAQINRLLSGESPERFLVFGLYACQPHGASSWTSHIDADFTDAASLAAFVRYALSCPRQYFFHCTLTPLRPASEDKRSMNEIRQLNVRFPHRVKDILRLFNSLLAVGELNNITPLIKFLYAAPQER